MYFGSDFTVQAIFYHYSLFVLTKRLGGRERERVSERLPTHNQILSE
jgi:hypothetical protein